jgi:hypothetical protein
MGFAVDPRSQKKGEVWREERKGCGCVYWGRSDMHGSATACSLAYSSFGTRLGVRHCIISVHLKHRQPTRAAAADLFAGGDESIVWSKTGTEPGPRQREDTMMAEALTTDYSIAEFPLAACLRDRPTCMHMRVCQVLTAAAWDLVAFSVVVFAAIEYHHH